MKNEAKARACRILFVHILFSQLVFCRGSIYTSLTNLHKKELSYVLSIKPIREKTSKIKNGLTNSVKYYKIIYNFMY